MFGWYLKRLLVLETGGTWTVEYNGTTVAMLDDPHFEEMFWASWRVTPLTDDPDLRALMSTKDFWYYGAGVTYRSGQFGAVCDTAIAAGGEPIQGDRVIMRGLYHHAAMNYYPWDAFALWLRRLWRNKALTVRSN